VAVVEPLPQPQPKPIVEDNTQEFAVDEGDMPTEEETVFNVVETQPEFPGGTKALMNYLMENILYPTVSHNNKTIMMIVIKV
jgi:protein TonB